MYLQGNNILVKYYCMLWVYYCALSAFFLLDVKD